MKKQKKYIKIFVILLTVLNIYLLIKYLTQKPTPPQKIDQKRIKIYQGKKPKKLTIKKSASKSPIHKLINTNKYAIFRVEDERPIIFGDILIDLPKEKLKTTNVFKLPETKYWSDGILPYEIDPKLADVSRVEEAILHINQNTIVQLVKRIDQEDYLYFTTGEKNCYSYVGRIGGKQPIYLSKGCTKGKVIHEVLHAIGLYHEQSRFDRDEFIQIQFWNIEEKYHHQFTIIDESIFPLHTPFDFNSIMLYASNAFAKDPNYLSIIRVQGDYYYPNEETLSDWDIEKINTLYQEVQ